MRTILITIAVLICGLAHAQLLHPEDARRRPLPFLAGIATSVAAHELGHVLVARSKGYDVALDGFTIVYPRANMTDADALQISAAGYQTQWLVAETVLRDAEGHPRKRLNTYRAGLVAGHLVVTTLYLAGLKDNSHSDVAGIARATGQDPNAIMAILLLPALCDAYRLTGKHVPTWAPRLSAGAKGVGMTVAWVY